VESGRVRFRQALVQGRALPNGFCAVRAAENPAENTQLNDEIVIIL